MLKVNFSQGQSQVNPRVQWFVDDRFGMFIHWGVYSGAEGFWKGEKLRDDNDYAEWIYYRNRIGREEYLELLKRFRWEDIDPEQWVMLAKRSGMKYVTITAKHHDGFALWDSQVTDYDVAEYTTPSRDIIAELASACKKHGLKLGLYYSHWVDWEHVYGWDHTREIHPLHPEKYDVYWQEKVMPQMEELLTRYGSISMLWFDMWVHHSETIVSKEQLLQLKNLIRNLQPDCLINSRLGLSLEEDRDVDFRTLGDNQLGTEKLDYPWQSPGTVAHSWGYHRDDTDWKSTTSLLRALINNVSLNGNYMLNIGPRSDGEVPFEITQRMEEMGRWLAVNGEAIYGSHAFDLPSDQHDWGRITYKKIDKDIHRIYLHIYHWPYHRKLPVTGIVTAPRRVYALEDKSQTLLPFHHQGPYTEIMLPVLQPNPFISVVVMEFDREPELQEGLTASTVSSGYALTPHHARRLTGDFILVSKKRRGSVPEHLAVDQDFQANWEVYFPAAGVYKADASYSMQHPSASGGLTLTVAAQKMKHKIQPTGLLVTEPNQNWHVENFASHTLGEFTVAQPGTYQIQLKITGGKAPVRFQWIWIKPTGEN